MINALPLHFNYHYITVWTADQLSPDANYVYAVDFIRNSIFQSCSILGGSWLPHLEFTGLIQVYKADGEKL